MKVLVFQVRKFLVCSDVSGCKQYPDCLTEKGLCDSAKHVNKVQTEPWVEGSYLKDIPEECSVCGYPINLNNWRSTSAEWNSANCGRCGNNLFQ